MRLVFETNDGAVDPGTAPAVKDLSQSHQPFVFETDGPSRSGGGSTGLGRGRGRPRSRGDPCHPAARAPLPLEDGYKRLQNRFRRMLANGPIPEGITVITRATPAEAWRRSPSSWPGTPASRRWPSATSSARSSATQRPGEDVYLVDYEVGTTLKKLEKLHPLLTGHPTTQTESNHGRVHPLPAQY